MNLKILLLSIPFLLQACAPFFVESAGEVRHRYFAVYSDDGKQIAIADESHLWDCSGTMARCYDHRTNYNLAIYLVDAADTSKKDTIMRPRPGNGGIEGYGGEGVLFHSNLKNRMIYHQQDTLGGRSHLYLTDARGKNEFDLLDIGDLRGHYVRYAVPSPDFTRLAIFRKEWSRFKVTILDLATRTITDTVSILTAPADTTASRGYRLSWESDTSLVVYGTGDYRQGQHAYRIRGNVLADTLTDIDCTTPKLTSSSPYSSDWKKVEMSVMGLKFTQLPPSNCLGYK